MANTVIHHNILLFIYLGIRLCVGIGTFCVLIYIGYTFIIQHARSRIDIIIMFSK